MLFVITTGKCLTSCCTTSCFKRFQDFFVKFAVLLSSSVHKEIKINTHFLVDASATESSTVEEKSQNTSRFTAISEHIVPYHQ